MSFQSSKLFFRSSYKLLSLAALVAAIFAAGSPAQALPVDVFFNGNRPTSDPTTAFGISLASATNARDNFGVPILTSVDVLTTIANRVSVILPGSSTLGVNPSPPTADQNRIDSRWKVKNVSGGTLEGASYLLFTHTDPYSVRGNTIDYADENVGLRIDAAAGWVIIRGQAQGVDYYYPALLLGNEISRKARVNAAIQYVVNEPLDGIRRGGKTKYYLPKLQLGYAQVVIPEPGTALLFGLGLTLLAAQRKHA